MYRYAYTKHRRLALSIQCLIHYVRVRATSDQLFIIRSKNVIDLKIKIIIINNNNINIIILI